MLRQRSPQYVFDFMLDLYVKLKKLQNIIKNLNQMFRIVQKKENGKCITSCKQRLESNSE